LLADDGVALPIAAPAAAASAAKASASASAAPAAFAALCLALISARFAAFWLAHITLGIKTLLALAEQEFRSAISTSNGSVWHGYGSSTKITALRWPPHKGVSAGEP
jgi:hypothetical protein